MTELSIIVPVRNAEEGVERLLAVLEPQVAGRDVEVLIADDGSTDATPDVVRRHPFARLIAMPEPAGPYAARNHALTQASGRLLAFTDGDCVPAPDWVERGIAAVDASAGGVVAGRIDIDLDHRPNTAALVDCARFLDQELYVSRGYGATANLWVTRAVIDRVGPFNARILSGGDAEWGLRAREAGAVTEYAGDVAILHESRDRLRAVARKAFRVGFGCAQHVQLAEGPLRAQATRRFSSPRFYVPHRTLPGLRRLETHGHRLSRRRRLEVQAAEYVFVRLPMAYGDFRGFLAGRGLAPRGLPQG